MRPTCGSCLTCQLLTVALAAPRREPARGPAPSPAALERHAKKYGPELVPETASEYGVAVKVEAPRRRRARGGPTLKERVAAHLEAGYSVDVIAELEDLSPSRARRLMEELEHAREET